MRHHRKNRNTGIWKHPYANLVGLWCTRILLDLEGMKELGIWGHRPNYTNSGAVLKAIGSGHLEDEELTTRKFKQVLLERQEHYLVKNQEPKGNLIANIRQLARLLHLDDTDQQILLFMVILDTHLGLLETANTQENLTLEGIVQVLAIILDICPSYIRRSLDNKSTLQRSGLLQISKNGSDSLPDKLTLAEGLSDTLYRRHTDVLHMLEQYFHPGSIPQLCADHFPHLDADIQLLVSYLETTLQRRCKGVNVLLYGIPGTGKTEFARILSTMVGSSLFEISTTGEDGAPLSNNHRFQAYRLTQEALSHSTNSLILFDEIEDVFPTSFDGFEELFSSNQRTNKKGWINNLLENNPIPAIWISNSIEQIDPAFLRRFDYALEIPTPPRSVRAEILRSNLRKTAVSRQWIESLAENTHLSPAIVARAAKLATMLENNDSVSTQECMERVMGNTLKAMGNTRPLQIRTATHLTYRLDVINPDIDIRSLLQGLKRHGSARLCLYGPPGTGKTELGKHIAQMLDKPLVAKRASDLLDMFVGGTEQRIVQMFSQARAEGAALLLDEADSFLRNRMNAKQSWEITQVNELLTQMEAFDGLFICSTNLMEDIDTASIRRFDFKIKFDYMTPDQVRLMFHQTLKDHGVRYRMSQRWASRLSRYRNLTPGDFATAVRQQHLSAQPLSAEALYEALGKEAEFKEKYCSAGIGFLTDL